LHLYLLYLNDIFPTAVLALDFAKIRNLTSVYVNESICRTILVILSLLAFLSVLTDSDSESPSPLSQGLATGVPMAAHVASAPPAPPAFGLAELTVTLILASVETLAMNRFNLILQLGR
jgi:hypothetical protein